MKLHRNRSLFLLAASLGLMAGLVGFAPARVLALLLRVASHDQVRLLNARGTIWQGRAELVLAGGATSVEAAALPQGLSWRLAPSWTSGPALKLSLMAPCCTPQGLDLQLGWGSGGPKVTIAPHTSRWPVNWLTGLGAPWNTLRLQGSLQLNTPGSGIEWAQGRARLQGPFELRVLDASSSLSTLKPLGSYRLRIEPDAGGSAQLQLDTLGGALSLSGEGQFTGGRLRFRGQAQAEPDSGNALSNLLNIMGRREGARTHISLG